MNKMINNINNVILNAVKNLNTSTADANRSFAPLRMTRMGAWMAILMATLTFSACSEEQDLPIPEQTSALHIASVTIDGQDVARARVVADGGGYPGGNIPFNESFNGFTEGDKLQLVTSGLSGYYSDGSAYSENTFYAIYNADDTWTISVQSDYTTFTPVTLKPAEGKKWDEASIEAALGGEQIAGEVYPIATQGMGIVQGDIPEASSIIFSDWLVAGTTAGSITIDTDVKSPTLGATTIQLKHAHALLRLPVSATNVTAGTYIKDGTAYNVTGLGTLWVVVKIGDDIQYCPLTTHTGTEYLQAIVPATSTDGAYTLTGFKAVMKVTDPSGASATSPNLGEESVTTVTLDLPFTVSSENSSPESGEVPQSEGSVTLQPNTQYPLTLTIAPHTSSVSLSGELGKPGWGTEDDENELSNEMNELLITVDGTEYIKLDGTATDVAKVKAIMDAAIAKGYTNFYVTGETLATYSSDNSGNEAKTVVGQAIYQLVGSDTSSPNRGTISLVLPDVTTIGEYAFYSCKALKSVSAPKVQKIEEFSFYYCTPLTSVSLDAVSEIGTKAFSYCSLTNLTLGTVTYLHIIAFDEVSTGICDLTLGKGQQHIDTSTLTPNGVPVTAADESASETDCKWASKIWKSITLSGNE